MRRRLTRIEPGLPVGSMKTYQILAPVATHFRPATCTELDCEAYVHGWRTTLDESTEFGRAQAWYIRNKSGRRFTEDRDHLPGSTTFTFEPGQKCFAEHQVRTGRPETFLVRGGDWRGNPTGQTQLHTNSDDWVDDFANHQAALADQLEKG